MVAIKADKKAKRKVCERINMRRVSYKKTLEMLQGKACKSIHIPASIKGIGNQVEDWQIKEKENQS